MSTGVSLYPWYCGDLRFDASEWLQSPGPLPDEPVRDGEPVGGLGLLRFAGEVFAYERRDFAPERRNGGLGSLPGPGYACDLLEAGEAGWLPRLDGGRGVIVDFLGIDSLVGGRHRHFLDSAARKIGLRLLGNPAGWYHRFGVAGLGGHPTHPGGEVVEWNLLDAAQGAGLSRSHAGHLAGDELAGNAWLAGARPAGAVDQRSDYSQTIWSPVLPPGRSETLAFRLRPTRQISLLDSLGRLSADLGLEAFGARLLIEVAEGGGKSHVQGRVLKRDPVKGWRNLEDARDSAVERKVSLQPGEKVLALGTVFPRIEPDWEAISNGRPYERRGHFHASLFRRGTPVSPERLKTFHLRDALLDDDAVATLEIIPASRAVRVHRVEHAGGAVISMSTRRTLA